MSDTAAAANIRWRARLADELVWAELDDAYVAYHRPSGKTHFLNAATAQLLEHVLTSPRTARAAAEELAEREGAPAAPEFVSAVEESLRQLEHLGLVDRCEP